MSSYPTDTITTADGAELKITFYAHASLGFEFAGKHIYMDPVSAHADYSTRPKADLIIVTHTHGDHLDAEAIKTLSKPGTQLIGNMDAVRQLGFGDGMRNGEARATPWLQVEAVPAYNTTPDRQGFHTPDGRDNGYVLTFGGAGRTGDSLGVGASEAVSEGTVRGLRVYVSGDTEDTPQMMALKDVDVAFLPVNQPYTMTEDQAARAVRALKPRIFYPFHTGQTDHVTDLSKLQRLLEGSGVDVRIFPME